MANGELPSAIVDVRSTDPIPEIPDSAIDTFEDYLYEDLGNTLDSYYTSGIEGSVQRQTSVVQEGSTSLEITTTNGGTSRLRSQPSDGLPNYPSAGDNFRYFFRISKADTGSFSDGVSLVFGTQADNDWYRIQYTSSGTFRLVNQSSGFDVISSSSITLASNKWYRVDCSWQTDGSFSIDLLETDGSLLTSLNATDTTYSSGGIGYLVGAESSITGYVDGVQLI